MGRPSIGPERLGQVGETLERWNLWPRVQGVLVSIFRVTAQLVEVRRGK